MNRRKFLKFGTTGLVIPFLSISGFTLPSNTYASTGAAPPWPGSDDPPEPSAHGVVEYMAHLTGTGDTDYIAQPYMCGSEGERRPMEGFTIRPARGSVPIGLRYKVHMGKLGDSGWVYLGEFAGSRGQRRQIEAIWIEVTGATRHQFEIYYQAHLAGTGWTSWEKNGQMCGTRGEKRAIQAIRIFLADKPEDAN